MPGPEPKTRVKAIQQDFGVLVPISRKQLEAMGLDPDHPNIEVNRTVFDSDRAECRLRLYEEKPDR